MRAKFRTKLKLNLKRAAAMLLCVLLVASSLPLSAVAAGVGSAFQPTTPALGQSTTPTGGSSTTSPDQQVVIRGGDEKVFLFTDSGSLPTDSTAVTEIYKSVSGEGTLVIDFGGTLDELTVTGEVNVGALTILGSGTLNIGGDLIVAGDLTCTGADVNVTGKTAVAGNMRIEGGTWATTGAVEVNGESISLTSVKLQNAALFGFAAATAGDKMLNLADAVLSGTGTVGIDPSNTEAVAELSGSYTLSAESCLVYDYRLNYKQTDGTEIQPQLTWPAAYRVKATPAGDSTEKVYMVNGAEASTFALPTAEDVVGYTFGGWKRTADAASAITALELADIGAVSELYVELIPLDVTVHWALGYTPDQYTNDAADPAFDCNGAIVTQPANSVLTLPTPFRFGYDFAGWQVMQGNEPVDAPYQGSMTIAPHCITPGATQGSAVLTLQAVWTPRKFPLKLQLASLPTGYTVDDVRLMASGDTEWLTVAEFAARHGGNVENNGTVMQFADASYGMTLGEYLESILPGLRIQTSDRALAFSHWVLNMVDRDPEDKIALGQGALFGATVPAGSTLRQFQEELTSTQLRTLSSAWMENRSDLQLSNKSDWNKNGLWSVYVNGVDQTAAIANTGSILRNIPVNGQVSFRVLAASTEANASFGLWTVYVGEERVPVTESVEGAYRCYTFTMPDTVATATFSSQTVDVMFNMKESPVSEQKIGELYGVWTNELIANLTPRYDTTGGGLGYAPSSELEGIDLADGWCNGEVAFTEMKYFYELPLAHYYYLTTNDANTDQTSTVEEGNGTHNQWRGGQRAEVYLKDCHLWATTYYTQNATLQEQITAAEEKKYFVGKLDKMANLYLYLTDGSAPKGYCFKQVFDGNNNIVGCIGAETYGQKSAALNDRSTTEIRIGARITNNPNGYDREWAPPAGSFYPYAHTTYLDNFGYWTFGATHNHAWGGVNLYLPHKMLSVGQAYNIDGGFIHVRSISMLALRSGGTMILEGDITEKFGFDAVNAGTKLVVRGSILKSGKGFTVSGSLTVLGDVFRVGTLTVNSGASLVANAIEVNALDIKGGTVLANVIRNHSTGGSGYTQATANGDNAVYTGYTLTNPTYVDNTNGANIAYRLTGGNIYLLGYRTTATEGASLLADASNPLHAYATALPTHTCVDGTLYPVLLPNSAYTDVLAELSAGVAANAVQLYEQNKTLNAASECFMLGNSAADNRKFVFAGTNIYAAGSMVFNNMATVSGGTVCASVFASKLDLFITGGTVEVGELGNAAAVQLARGNGTLRYAKTEITGGSIKADRIGALSTSAAGENRSSLTVLAPGSLAPYTEGGNIALVHDALVYYSIDTSKFASSDAASFAVRITAAYNPALSLTEQGWSLTEPTQEGGSFATINYADTYAGTGVPRWSLSQNEGIFAVSYDASGRLLDGNGQVLALVAGSDGVVLFAIEVSQMTLSVTADSGAILGITEDGAPVELASELGILSGAAVAVTINPSMRDKVIFGYRDDKGILHNLFPTVSADGTTVSFSMPFMACELYVVSRYTLYLNEHEIYFQSDSVSFRTELSTDNADRAFRYAGEIYITRSDTGTGLLSHKLQFEKNFDADLRGRIILHNLTLTMATEEATKVTLYIDGTGGKTVYFPGGERTNWIEGSFLFCGLNGRDTDVFKTDSYTFAGKYDRFSFADLRLIAGTLFYPSSSVSGTRGYLKEATLTNCRLDISGIIIYNANSANVSFTDCQINLGSAAMLSSCNSVMVLKNCTVTGGTYQDGNSRFTGSLTLDNTTFIHGSAPTTAALESVAFLLTLVLKNNSVFESNFSLLTKDVTVEGGSVLRVGYDPDTAESLGRLSVLSLTAASNGAVYAKYVICSGHDSSNRDYVYTDGWSTLANGASYNGIVVDGGAIYASEFVGGDYNGKITLRSGRIEAKYIGTYGCYLNGGVINSVRPFVYNGTATVYQISNIQILGGTVLILRGGHLGGGGSTVHIQNATVLGEGLSAFALEPVAEGETSIIGEEIVISGADTAVRVDNILSENGSITIADANGEHFDNGYLYSGANNDMVAVYIENELRANTLLIDSGAVVYAQNAYSYADLGGQNGAFTVTQNSGAELYTKNFGHLGGGDHDLDYESDNAQGNQNLWGNVSIAINYYFGDLRGESDEWIVNSNPTYFSYAAGERIELAPLSHPYLKFEGWVDAHGNPAPYVNMGLIPGTNVVERYATWSLKEVEIVVTVDSSIFGDEDIAREVDMSTGTFADGVFTWSNTITGYYTARLWGSENEWENLFQFANYPLNTHTITMLELYTPNGTVRLEGSIITKEMVDAYYADGANGPLQIKIVSVSKTALNMSFHLNKVNGKPGDAAFGSGVTGERLDIYANMGVEFNSLADAQAVIGLTATGYTFLGWSTNPNADPNSFQNTEFDPNGLVGTDFLAKDWYAVWLANPYYVTFAPCPDSSGSGHYYVTDDASVLPTDANAVDPDRSYTVELKYDQMLDWSHLVPTVWQEGYVFDSWYYIDPVSGESKSIFVTSNDVFSAANPHFGHVDFTKGGSSEQPMIKFYAKFVPLQVTYTTNGGSFTGGAADVQEYTGVGAPLRGYIAQSAATADGGFLEIGAGYGVFSTTAAYFNANKEYATGDYRETLRKVGYTFQGWYLDAACTQAAAVTPRFSASHITVYAKWEANRYQVILNAAHGSYEESEGGSGATFTKKDGEGYTDNASGKIPVMLQIGELITDANWPARNLWGTRQDGTIAPRPLWGFVFDPMDPWYPGNVGSTAAEKYIEYNEAVKTLNKNGELFVKNINRFALPNNEVDYPNGAEVQMYAVYNEYAIVFMQYYRDSAGVVTQRVIETVQYGAIDANTLANVQAMEIPLGEGYTPLGWYVNKPELESGREFKVADFVGDNNTKFNAYKEEALRSTYDIIIYHIYAVDQKQSGVAFASDPLAQTYATVISSRVQELTVPVNMQPGVLCYSFLADAAANTAYSGALGFADAAALRYYDFAQASTVGLKVEIYRGDELKATAYLGGATGDTGIAVQPGDRLVLTLYHSYVITQDSENSFDLSFTFREAADGGKAIPGQRLLLDDVSLTLTPAQYRAVFHASSEGKVLVSGGSFDLAAGIDTVEVSGDALTVFRAIAEMPRFVGYNHATTVADAQQWHNSTAVVTVNGDAVTVAGMLTYGADGVLHLYAAWEAVQRSFQVDNADANISTQWKVEYQDTDGNWVEITGSEALTLAYGTQLRFSPRVEDPEASYVTLNIRDSEPMRLGFDIPKTAEVYLWSMPDADVSVTYSNVLELFLENGSIVLMPGYFYQDKPGNIWRPWCGTYYIRQNLRDDISLSTANTVTVNGGMTGQAIKLGKLNISGENSIRLDKYSDAYLNFVNAQNPAVGKNVTLTLTANIGLANILVPEDASLTVVAENAATVLTLEPKNGVSAIGQSSGARNSAITLRGFTVIVKESGEYTGVWFGGKDTASVTLEYVTLIQAADYGIGNRYVTYADRVTLTGCTVGTEAQPIAEPIYALSSLIINGGSFYLQPAVPQGSVSMIGTGPNGTISINADGTDSVKLIIKYVGGYRSDKPFTGTVLLNDPKASIVIDNMLLLDTKYGSIVIGAEQVEQGTEIKSHSGNYIILQELDSNAVDVTVNAEKTLLLVQPKAHALVLGTLTVSAAAEVAGQASAAGTPLTLKISALQIKADVELSMELAAADTVELAANALSASAGTYKQSNGALQSTASIEGTNMYIVLEDVTVTAAGLVAKELTLDGCEVTCTGGAVGSYGIANGTTTVTLINSSITATTVGALGTVDETFIKVAITGDVYVTGTLVRDIYRIAYQHQAGYLLDPDAATTLRTSQPLDGTAPVSDPVSDTDRVQLAKPSVESGKTNKFVTWYLPGAQGKIALFEENGFDPAHWSKYQNKFYLCQSGLGFADAVYAVDENGIPTVTVYAFYTISGTVGLKEEQLFEAFIGSENITVVSDRGWSAFFTIESTREEGEDYAAIFKQAQPAGTKLILVWLDSNGKPMYYYYTMDGVQTTVLFSDFRALGGSNTDKLVLGKSDNEKECFILTVDYTDVAQQPSLEQCEVGFGYKADAAAAVEELCMATVTVTPAATQATLKVNGGALELTTPNNPLYIEKQYGYAILVEVVHGTEEKDLPYTAAPTVTGNVDGQPIKGQLIGGDMLLFVLGAYGQTRPTELTVSDLPQGYQYRWSVVLLETPDQVNVLKTLSN